MAHNGAHALDVPEVGAYGVEPGQGIEVEDSGTRGRLKRQGWAYVNSDPETNSDDDNTDTDEEGDDE